MDEEPGSSFAENESGVNINDLSLPVLNELLQRNRMLQNEIISTLDKLLAKINHCMDTRAHLEILIEDVALGKSQVNLDSSTIFAHVLDSSSWHPSHPYFLDSSNFGPPLNNGALIMNRENYITISTLRPACRWSQEQMRLLDSAVKNDALYRLQAGLKHKKKVLIQKLEEKHSLKQMLDTMDIVNEDIEKQIREGYESGRSIEELEKSIKETEEEIERVAGEPLRKMLNDPDLEFDWDKIADEHFKGKRSGIELRSMWKQCLVKTLSRKPWSKKESLMILEMAEKHKQQNWFQIAHELGGKRSAYQLFIHFQSVLNRTRNRWTESEDNAVVLAVKKLRMGNFIPYSLVANHVPGRSGSQIAARWRSYLDPSIYRGTFAPKEDIVLYICRALKKMSYGEISAKYVQRTTDQLRKRFFVLKSSDAFQKMLLNKGFYIDPEKTNLASLSVRKLHNVFKPRKGISLGKSSSSTILEIPEAVAKQSIDLIRKESSKKFYLKEENLQDGRKVLKVEEKAMGRPNRIYSRDELNLAMHFFSMWKSGRKGRPSVIRAKNIESVVKVVQYYLEKLGARLDWNAASEIDSGNSQVDLVLETLQHLSIESKPINSIIPPQFPTLIGYISIILEVAKLHKFTLAYPNEMASFRVKNENAAAFMNSRYSLGTAPAKENCQNLHLVPSDSVKPTLTVHLHKEKCNGRHSTSKHLGIAQIASDSTNVCGNIQELYFIEKGNDHPTFKLSLGRNAVEQPASGIVIDCSQKEPPISIMSCDDSEHISPEEALDQWKLRFIALFSGPAMIENTSPPVVSSLQSEVGDAGVKRVGKTYYKKIRKNQWKLRAKRKSQEARKEKASSEEATKEKASEESTKEKASPQDASEGTVDKAKKPRRRRRNAAEMKEVYAQRNAGTISTRAQRSKSNSGQVSSVVKEELDASPN